MSETKFQIACSECGYPKEAGHKPGCSLDNQEIAGLPGREGVEDSELTQVGMPDPDTYYEQDVEYEFSMGNQNDSDTVDYKKFRRSGYERIKKVLSRLSLWGLLTVEAIAGIQIGYERTDTVPDTIGKPVNTLLYKTGLVSKEMLSVAERQEARRLAAEQEELRLQERLREEKMASLRNEFIEENKQDIEYLTSVLGQERVDDFLYSQDFLEDKKDTAVASDVVVAGFEDMDFSNADFSGIINTTYPKGWVKGEIDSVLFEANVDSARLAMGEKYNMPGKRAAAEAQLKDSGINTLRFFQTAGNMTNVVGIMGHESGHANDWRSENELSAHDKLALWSQVTKRYCEGKNILHSDYVESINNPDTAQNIETKVTEYWAEICEEYFIYPTWLQQEHSEDFTLVDEWVKKQDPDFDPFKAARIRDGMVDEIQQSVDSARVAEFVSSLPEGMKTDLDSIALAQAREMQRKIFLDGGYGVDFAKLHNHINDLRKKYNIKDFDVHGWNVLTNYVTDKADEMSQTHNDEWGEALISEALGAIGEETRVELEAYKKNVLSELESHDPKELFNWTDFENRILQEIESICAQHHVQGESKILLRWVLNQVE
ncbi:MAG: hypothetical protein WC289_04585 [Patescibacteria group bacterium]|jgi:hypothetical protein